jgi:hypothetical protein
MQIKFSCKEYNANMEKEQSIYFISWIEKNGH